MQLSTLTIQKLRYQNNINAIYSSYKNFLIFQLINSNSKPIKDNEIIFNNIISPITNNSSTKNKEFRLPSIDTTAIVIFVTEVKSKMRNICKF